MDLLENYLKVLNSFCLIFYYERILPGSLGVGFLSGMGGVFVVDGWGFCPVGFLSSGVFVMDPAYVPSQIPIPFSQEQ